MAKNPIEFWLSYGNDRIQLPVNPESISFKSPFDFTEVNVNRLGGYQIPGYRGLKEFSFESFFPLYHNAAYCSTASVKKPWDLVNKIEKWRDSRKPMRLVITGTGINYSVTLTDFDIEPEKAGHPGDIFYSMSFKEYREVSVLKTSNKTSSNSKKRPTPTKNIPRTYTVVRGDCLWKIAKRFYGKGSKWTILYNANRKVVGSNPHLILPKQKLVIP